MNPPLQGKIKKYGKIKRFREKSNCINESVYIDEGVTGTKMARRDGLLRLLADCEKGLIDYIIVKSISRFSRNTVDSIETVRKLCELGIYIYFEKENINTLDAKGEVLMTIMAALAQQESESLSANVRLGFSSGTRQGEGES